jgi:hypothetical protein
MLPTITDPPKYSFAEIRAKAIKHLGSRPCLWQIRVVEAILKRDGDVVCIAATGSGKTLTFWLPLLFRSSGIQLIISPLIGFKYYLLKSNGRAMLVVARIFAPFPCWGEAP